MLPTQVGSNGKNKQCDQNTKGQQETRHVVLSMNGNGNSDLQVGQNKERITICGASPSTSFLSQEVGSRRPEGEKPTLEVGLCLVRHLQELQSCEMGKETSIFTSGFRKQQKS